MSDRVGAEGFSARANVVQEDANRLRSFEAALRTATPSSQGASPGQSAGQIVRNAPVFAARDADLATLQQSDGAPAARPNQSSNSSKGSNATEGCVEASGEDDRDQAASSAGAKVGRRGRSSTPAVSRVRERAARDEQQLPEDGPAAKSRSSEVATETASPLDTTAPGELEKAAVLEALQAIADGTLTRSAKDRLKADINRRAEGGAFADTASPLQLLDIITGLETLAADLLANGPYEDIDFANLFDQLFWVGNWLALFGAGGDTVDFEQSVDYSVGGAMAMPMEIMLTRACIEPLKPTEWDRPSRLFAASGAEDPIVGLDPGTPDVLGATFPMFP